MLFKNHQILLFYPILRVYSPSEHKLEEYEVLEMVVSTKINSGITSKELPSHNQKGFGGVKIVVLKAMKILL